MTVAPGRAESAHVVTGSTEIGVGFSAIIPSKLAMVVGPKNQSGFPSFDPIAVTPAAIMVV